GLCLSWFRPYGRGGGSERRPEASSDSELAAVCRKQSGRGPGQVRRLSDEACCMEADARVSGFVLISTNVQEALTPSRTWTYAEEWNVERIVRDSRDGPRDLGRCRCRHPCDGLRVAGESGDGRRHGDRGGLESALQRERRAHADDGERDELQRRACASVVVGPAELHDDPCE